MGVRLTRRARRTFPYCPTSSTLLEESWTPNRRQRTSYKWAFWAVSCVSPVPRDPPLRPGDPASPHAHLHAQAYLGPIDMTAPGATFWRRNVVFAAVNWWSIQDLRAEIRWVWLDRTGAGRLHLLIIQRGDVQQPSQIGLC